MEPLTSAEKRSGGDGAAVPEVVLGLYVREQIGCSLMELAQLGYEDAMVALGYAEGAALAQWAAQNPRGGSDGTGQA